MNFKLSQVPDRTTKPRQYGLTMVMDKGLSIRQIEDMLEISAPHIDIVKLGWATSFVTPNLKDKIAVYKNAGIPVYFGGTLFEAFVVRNQFEDYGLFFSRKLTGAILKLFLVHIFKYIHKSFKFWVVGF